MAFGIYVHWPFCAAKCPYCDFNSHVRHNPIDQKMYVEAYKREISHMASLAPGREVKSVFFGGGTPSLMEPETVDAILEAIAKNWHIPDGIEMSMEANPSSVEAERFKEYRATGVNRVSLGVQSLNDDQLKFLGRLHNADEARAAIEIARNTFDRISFDMIYARPDQTPEAWKKELGEALELAADHLSLYQLTIEQGTTFFDLRLRGKLTELQDNQAAELYELTQEMTAASGFETYEISNHAKPGAQCEHNLIYWRGHEYAGIGPGAHGRLHTNKGRLATANLRNPEIWWQQVMVQNHGMEIADPLERFEHADEFLLMGLRLAEGLSLTRFEEIAGHKIDPDQISFLTSIGMLEQISETHVRATLKGFLVLDAVVADLAMQPEHKFPV